MLKRRKPTLAQPASIQVPLFTETTTLIRTLPERDEHRYYRLEAWPDLFGRALLVCSWSRSGTRGCHRLDPHPDPGAAMNALAACARAVRRRGYKDCTL